MTVRDRLVDLGVVAAAAAGIEVTIAVAREAGTKPPGIAGYLLGTAMALPLLARRSHPVAAVFATSAVLFVYYAGNAGFPTVADRSAGLARLPALVSAVQAAGLTLSVQTAGQPATLPSTVDHAAYRILQEALTNVLRHAGPQASATVRLEYGATALGLEVFDDGAATGGTAAGSSLPGGGHGVNGMRERAQALGGTLVAGPAEAGGFAVRARLPFGTEEDG